MHRKRFQLGLVHVAVAMTLVPINSTLNRVMIKELAISAALVAAMASLPYLISPVQVLIGSYSDSHPYWGLRRTPYIALGLLMCVAGVAISPHIAFLMIENMWLGIAVGLLAFGAWGIGYNLAAVAYLSLATEISGEKGRGKTIAVMWFMMIVGIILTSITLGRLVDPYTPEALEQAFYVVSGAALLIGLTGLVKLETRDTQRVPASEGRYSWRVLISSMLSSPQVKLFFIYLMVLLAALLGQDILLEPFAAEAFDLSVRETTYITSYWGVFVLVAILIAGFLEGKVNKRSVAFWGGWGALVGFMLIAGSGIVLNQTVFYAGIVFLGIGTGISTVSNLSLMLDMTVASREGMFIGAWGAANAMSRLLGSVLGGVVRDVIGTMANNMVIGYVFVFAIMTGLMLLSIFLLRRIDVGRFQSQTVETSVIERAALAGEG